MYLLGQIFGILATIVSIIVPLYKKKWQMLVNTLLINLLMVLNFLCIGQIGSGAALCTVAVVQCISSLIHTRKDTQASKAETAIFIILYLSFGFLGLISAPGFQWAVNYRNCLELLPIVGSMLSMTFVFIRDEQRARWFLLATCLVWSLYTALIGSTTFFAQFTTVLTTIGSMIRYRKKK